MPKIEGLSCAPDFSDYSRDNLQKLINCLKISKSELYDKLVLRFPDEKILGFSYIDDTSCTIFTKGAFEIICARTVDLASEDLNYCLSCSVKIEDAVFEFLRRGYIGFTFAICECVTYEQNTHTLRFIYSNSSDGELHYGWSSVEAFISKFK